MSAESPALVRSWSVGRYTCTLLMPKVRGRMLTSCVIEWTPEQPRKLTEAEIAQYRAGRDAAFAELALALNRNVAVVDL